jgi:hypothetical protein
MILKNKMICPRWAMMGFISDVTDEVWKEQLSKTHSIRDFQCNFIYHTIRF